ncbi:MAG: PrpR N-terminal domain-containing protein [Oscillospiraceae bacterium]
MEKVRIVAVAPYEGMKNMLEALAAGREDICLTSYVGDLQNGADIVRGIDAESYDVIISRGGTAEAIMAVTGAPVIEVTLSPYDILGAITMAMGIGKPFAIVGFPGIAEPSRILCDILKYEVEIVDIHGSDEVPSAMEALKARGVGMVLSDTIGTATAKRMGMDAMLITSGARSIEDTLNKASSYFRSFGKLKRANSIYAAALREEKQRVLMFSEGGELMFCSPEKNPSSGLKTALRRLVPALLREGELRSVKRIGSQNYLISGRRLRYDEHPCAFFRVTDEGQSDRESIPGVGLYSSREADFRFVSLFYNENGKSGLWETAKRLAASGRPIVIRGERGTGKDELMGFICQQGGFCDERCYVVDCARLDERGRARLLKESGSFLCDTGISVYFKNLTCFGDAETEELLDFIEGSGMQKRCRLIFSETDGSDRPREERLLSEICERLSARVVRLPSLRERMEEFPALVSMCLNEINIKQGTQMIGVEPEGVSLLQSFDWESNLDQLLRVLNRLAAISSLAYVSAESVAEVLKAERSRARRSEAQSGIALDGTLDEICCEVVSRVLTEENMSRSRTAQRLGISRATVWRMLTRQKEGKQ